MARAMIGQWTKKAPYHTKVHMILSTSNLLLDDYKQYNHMYAQEDWILVSVFHHEGQPGKWVFGWNLLRICVFYFTFLFFFFFFFFFWHAFRRQFSLLRLLFMYCSWTVAAQFDFSILFQHISGSHALFTGPTNLIFQ